MSQKFPFTFALLRKKLYLCSKLQVTIYNMIRTISNTKTSTLIRLWITITLTTVCSIGAQAQTAEDTVYVFLTDQPNAGYFIPTPPDSVNIDFVDDLIQWQWARTQKGTPRGEKASRESVGQPSSMRSIMAQVLELDTISDEKTPALSRLLSKAYNTGAQSTAAAKDFVRTRPFGMMNEEPWALWDKGISHSSDSYPSDHAACGWATALAFGEMWPALQDTIWRRGFEYGENRVITGAHWQSDVYAGYLCGAASIARAHTNPEFHKDILAARAEYAALKGKSADYDPSAEADLPHGEDFLNNPVDTTNYRYLADVMRYWKAKEQRDTERGDRAASEAEYSEDMMRKVFGEAVGMTLSPETTPAISELIDSILVRSSDTADRLKPIRFRKRPFVQLGDPSFVPGDEEKERGKSSFPSGHTNLGWTTALIMAEVAPDHQDEILRRGYEYGYNRLIVGYHWASDIEVTRLLASALVARLHADAEISQLIAKACAEYKEKATGIEPATRTETTTPTARIYRLDGTPATDTTRGIIIQNGQKSIRKHF